VLMRITTVMLKHTTGLCDCTGTGEIDYTFCLLVSGVDEFL